MRDRVDQLYGVDPASACRSEAYDSVPLAEKQALVLDRVACGADTAWAIYRMDADKFAGVHSVRPRLIELEKQGLIEITGSRVFPDTGRPCTVWGITPKGEIVWKKLKPSR